MNWFYKRGISYVSAGLTVLSINASAAEVTGLTAFTAGKPVKAADINTNFNALKTGVNDHDSRITTLETTAGGNSTLSTRVTAIENHQALTLCPPDMVPNGPACIDKYESSVWETSDASLIVKIRTGTAAKVDFNAGNSTQHGASSDDYGSNCPDTANGCKTFYSVSIAGVKPAAFLTWFQAASACRNAGKRLPTNQEWQVAAFGTPDPGTEQANNCNVASGAKTDTGARSLCVSDVGAFDMVGNLWEWTADWTPGSTPSTPASRNTPLYGEDYSSTVGSAADQGGGANMPAVLVRGGYNQDSGFAGAFAFSAYFAPSQGGNGGIGFRCAK